MDNRVRSIRMCSCTALAALGLLCGASSAMAQTTATLTGSIEDTSGGVLPGAQLTLRQPDTGLVRTMVSDRDGRFVFAVLPAGTYDLRAELSGFRTVVRRGLALTVAATASVTLVMTVLAWWSLLSLVPITFLP